MSTTPQTQFNYLTLPVYPFKNNDGTDSARLYFKKKIFFEEAALFYCFIKIIWKNLHRIDPCCIYCLYSYSVPSDPPSTYDKLYSRPNTNLKIFRNICFLWLYPINAETTEFICNSPSSNFLKIKLSFLRNRRLQWGAEHCV